jgi:hypothetical protein
MDSTAKQMRLEALDRFSPEELEERISALIESDESMEPVLTWASKLIKSSYHDLDKSSLTLREIDIAHGRRALAMAYLVAGSPRRRKPVQRGRLRAVEDLPPEEAEPEAEPETPGKDSQSLQESPGEARRENLDPGIIDEI